jgi:hypothetical protein
MNRLPFGLNSAPSLWSRIIKDILAPVDQEKLIVYIDDMALMEEDVDGLIGVTNTFLQCIMSNNVKLSAEKCDLYTDSISILGHRIDKTGIRLSFDSTERVRTFPAPKTAKQLQSLIGLANWAMKFTPYYGKLMKPLFQAVKARPFKWTKACESALTHLKMQICSEPVLVHYNEKLPLYLITDASLSSFGCVLAHKIEDIFHPIFFYGRCFTSSELSYNIFEKELKGLYLSVRALSAFLKGKPFTILVDNAGVAFLKTLSLKHHLSQKWGRWVSYLSEFDFEISHIPTNANPADCLSRRSCDVPDCPACGENSAFHSIPFKFNGKARIVPQPTVHQSCQTPTKWQSTTCSSNEQHVTTNSIKISDKLKWPTEDGALRRIQMEDPDLSRILERKKENRNPPEAPDLQSYSQQSRRFLVLWDKLAVKNEVLFLKISTAQGTKELPIIPRDYYLALCIHVHEELMHPGFDRLFQYLRQNFAVYGMGMIAKHCTRSCDSCQRTKSYTRSTTPHMTSNIATFPGACVTVDHFGPLPTANGYSYVLAITDVFSKYVILVAQKKIDTEETARAIFQHYVTTWGTPLRINCDNGPAFASEVWQRLWSMLGTSVTYATPYHPKANSQVERFNSTLKNALIICSKSYSKSWPHFLPTIAMSHNATVSKTTGYTSNFLQMGREIPLPTNVLVNEDISEIEDIDSFVSHYAIRMQKAFAIARSNTSAAQKMSKIFYDRNASAVNAYLPGQKVLLKDLANRKLDFRFPDTCVILQRLHNHQYLIKRERDGFIRKANIAQLKPYTPLYEKQRETTNRQTQTIEQPRNEPMIDLIEDEADVTRYDDEIDLPQTNNDDLNLSIPTAF